MYTECPSCKTVFKITASHLKIAHGKVRCGSCNTVFNALDSLIENYESNVASARQDASSTGANAPNPVETSFDKLDIPGMELEETAAPASKPAGGFDAGDDIFSQPARSEIAAEGAQPEMELAGAPDEANGFGALDLTGDLGGDLGGTAAPEAPALEAATSDDFGLGDLATESTSPEMSMDGGAKDGLDFDLDFGDEKPKSEDGAMNLSPPAGDELDEFLNEQEKAVSRPEPVSTPPPPPPTKKPPFDDSSAMAPEFEARRDEPIPSMEIGKAPAGAAEDYVLQELGRKSIFGLGWLGSLFWSALIAILLMVLVLQFAYFKRAELAKYPSLRPVLDQLCAAASRYVDCTVPLPVDVHAIDLMDRDVRSHPNKKNALLITSTILNKAEFVQPFPVLQITFSDINQKTVAAREFQPNEYLDKEIALKDGMKPNVPIRIMLEIVDPGPEAVNFEFVFKPKLGE